MLPLQPLNRLKISARIWRFALPVLASLALNACRDHDRPVDPAPEDYCHAPANQEGHPKAAQYQALLDSYVQKGLPGVVLLVKTPRDGLWIGAAGKANRETGEAMTRCSLNYPQSIAKSFTATAMMMLVEEGKVRLDARISEYLPQRIISAITNADRVTLRQLLQHTSGIYNYLDDEGFQADALANLNNPNRTYTTEEYLSYAAGKPAYFEPGTAYKYSDTNYELAALIIDQVTGRNHADMFTERIFRPLGLRDIYYKNEPGYPTPRGLVASYANDPRDGSLINVSNFQTRSVRSFIGDDGLISSAYDLARFVEALGKGQLVKPESLRQMTQWVNTYSTTPNVQYGLGLYKFDTPYGIAFGHDGDGLGAGAQMFYFPDSGVTYVAFTNIGTFLPGPAARLFQRELQADVQRLAFQ
ncbi:beta-lactamase family protein [Hymenobacter sp. BT664]|uniref:Beta-lactamase family protein n=1 Tax=Hymenobacter montanus TaxID=2771359 RepID=A0A927BDM3_9BACT|nr:serine hydrolase domain-containing protein [Hymenobacter montanus]MBD2768891.1 beta-lactamase family protein [Hymenobacter montanus]